jgi:uncharacterized membrane protein
MIFVDLRYIVEICMLLFFLSIMMINRFNMDIIVQTAQIISKQRELVEDKEHKTNNITNKKEDESH